MNSNVYSSSQLSSTTKIHFVRIVAPRGLASKTDESCPERSGLATILSYKNSTFELFQLDGTI